MRSKHLVLWGLLALAAPAWADPSDAPPAPKKPGPAKKKPPRRGIEQDDPARDLVPKAPFLDGTRVGTVQEVDERPTPEASPDHSAPVLRVGRERRPEEGERIGQERSRPEREGKEPQQPEGQATPKRKKPDHGAPPSPAPPRVGKKRKPPSIEREGIEANPVDTSPRVGTHAVRQPQPGIERTPEEHVSPRPDHGDPPSPLLPGKKKPAPSAPETGGPAR